MDHVHKLIDKCKQWCFSDRKIKWGITGGEPFLDSNFVNIVELLYVQPFTEQITTISNGSLPLENYLQVAKFVTGITFSLHLERSESELNKTIQTIIAVKQQTNILISVNVMFLTGRADQVCRIVDQLKQHNIAYVVRLITPIDSSAGQIKSYINDTADRKSIILKSADELRRDRQHFKIKNDSRAPNNIQNYYSNDELSLLEKLNRENVVWHNAGIWLDDDSYAEVNTDQLVSSGKTGFKNWICYAGVDSIYVDWNGTIYRGLCLNDGPIGHINDDDDLSTVESTICQQELCGCNTDIAVRKSRNADYLKLIWPISE